MSERSLARLLGAFVAVLLGIAVPSLGRLASRRYARGKQRQPGSARRPFSSLLSPLLSTTGRITKAVVLTVAVVVCILGPLEGARSDLVQLLAPACAPWVHWGVL